MGIRSNLAENNVDKKNIEKRKITNKLTGILLSIFLVCVFATKISWINDLIIAKATFNKNKTVQLTDNEIMPATVVIGTHLIDVHYLDEHIYEIAKESAAESNQNKMYYKSELTDGIWYDVTDAASISDITSGGIPVEASVIEQLKFTNYTRNDGITYDLNSGNAVCIYDIISPYELENLPELLSINQNYVMLRDSSKKTDSDKYVIKTLNAFFDAEVSNKETENYDLQLETLFVYYRTLTADNASAFDRRNARNIMKALDAKRRAVVYRKLSESILPTLLKRMEGNDGNNAPKDYIANEDINNAIGEAIKSTQSAYQKYSKIMLQDSEYVMNSLKYTYSNKVIKYASQGDQDNCDRYLNKLGALVAIQSNQKINEDRELDLIDEELLDEVDSNYINVLGNGVSTRYATSKEDGATKAALDRLLILQQQEADKAREELQQIIAARLDRITNEKGQIFLLNRIDEIGQFQNSIKEDEFQKYAEKSLSEYKNWLTVKLKNLMDNNIDSTDMSKLLSNKEKLTTELQEALDNNNLALEAKLSAELDAVNMQISEKEKELIAIIKSEDSSNRDKSIAQASLGRKSVSADIFGIKQNIIENIQKDEFEKAKTDLDGIETLMSKNSQAGIVALKEINNELSIASETSAKSGEAKKLQKQVRAMIANYAEIEVDSVSAELIDSVIKSYYGFSFEDLNAESQIAVLVALNKYNESVMDDNINDYINTHTATAYEGENKYIYKTIDNMNTVYINSYVLSKCIKYRYIVSNSQKKCILQKGSEYYSFTALSNRVKRSSASDAKTDNADEITENFDDDILQYETEFSEVVYIPEEYVNEHFNISALNIKNSGFSTILNDAIEDEAEDFQKELKELR